MDQNSHKDTHVFKWKPFLRQLHASSAVWTIYFVVGLSLGTPTVTIPQLRKEFNSTSSVSDEMGSWISSVTGFTAAIWSVILTPIAHYLGRKKSVILTAVVTIIASLLLFLSRNVVDVMISLILFGFTLSSSTVVAMFVVAEYSTPRYRGIFLTLKSATFFWGIWVANAIGAFFNYRNIGLFSIFCSIYILISAFYMPESPLWLASNEKYEQCLKSHRWLRGSDENAENELETMISAQKEIKSRRKVKKSVLEKIVETLQNIFKPQIYKPLAIVFLITMMYQSSGKFVCTMYSLELIKKITDNESSAYTGMLVLDGITVLGMYFGSGLSKILKRRTLLLSASSIAAFFLFSMSLYLYLVRLSLISENSTFSISLLGFYSLAVCCGPMVLLSSIMVELTPLMSRSSMTLITASMGYLNLGLFLKMMPYIFRNIGFDGAFAFIGTIFTITIILVYFYLPETKDKTLYEIADIFKPDELPEQRELELLNRNSTQVRRDT